MRQYLLQSSINSHSWYNLLLGQQSSWECTPYIQSKGGFRFLRVSNLQEFSGQKGKDPTNLGQWCWVRLRGKLKTHVRFVLAYRPNSSLGPNTVYAQQVQYFWDHKDIPNPNLVDLFDRDLLKHLKKWIEGGDQIVLGIDANTSVELGPFINYLNSLVLRL